MSLHDCHCNFQAYRPGRYSAWAFQDLRSDRSGMQRMASMSWNLRRISQHRRLCSAHCEAEHKILDRTLCNG